MGFRLALPCLLFLLSACSAYKPTYVAPPDWQREPPPTLIRNVLVFDGLGGGMSGPHDVLLARGRVLRVDPPQTLRVADDVEVVEGSGKTLLPGLTDMGVWLGSGDEDPRRTLEGLLTDGVTTAVVLGRKTDAQALQRAVIRGSIPGPRLYRSTRAIELVDAEGVALQPKEASRETRRELERYRSDFVLVRASGSAFRQALAAVVGEVRIYQKGLIVHALDGEAAALAAATGASAIFLDDAPPLEEAQLRALSVAQVPVILDLSRAEENALLLWDMGAPLLVASGDGEGAPSWQSSLEALAARGIPEEALLEMITSLPPRLLDPTAAFGVITTGSYADLLLVRGDPSRDIRALQEVEAVWQAGHRLRPPETERALAGPARQASLRD